MRLVILYFILLNISNCLRGQIVDCQKSILDIVLAIDSSASIGSSNFEIAKNAIHKFVSNLNIGPSKTQVGIINYSCKFKLIHEIIFKKLNIRFCRVRV